VSAGRGGARGPHDELTWAVAGVVVGALALFSLAMLGGSLASLFTGHGFTHPPYACPPSSG
jgi:hypothetical protein